MMMQIHETATPPHERTDEISAAYSQLIIRMMHKDPGARHQTWAEVAEAFEALLSA